MLGLFQAKSRDLHMTPVCLEVIITKTQGGHIRPTKGLPQGKRLWISARMLRVIKQQDEHRATKGTQRAASASQRGTKPSSIHTRKLREQRGSICARCKTAYSTHQKTSRNPFSCSLRGKIIFENESHHRHVSFRPHPKFRQ